MKSTTFCWVLWALLRPECVIQVMRGNSLQVTTRKLFSALCRACLSCRISCSTAPGVTCTSSVCRLHVIHASSACHPCIVCTSSVHHLHIIHASSARHPHIVRVSSAHACVICACVYVVHTRTRHPHIVCRPSAPLLMVTVGWTIFYCDRNLLLNGICGRNVELFHFRIM